MASIPCPGECGTRLHFDITAIKVDHGDGARFEVTTTRSDEMNEHANRCADWALKVWSGK